MLVLLRRKIRTARGKLCRRKENTLSAIIDTPRPLPAAPCLDDADRWLDGGDDPELKALCRACPRRWPCAEDALRTPNAQGMWSGVHLPGEGRQRAFALRQLRSLAAHGRQRSCVLPARRAGGGHRPEGLTQSK
jgi:WhiB family transcriptional regulator, redox-sensing transcriptional regulator